jgi:hypothetical protein
MSDTTMNAPENATHPENLGFSSRLAEGEGFEPPLGLLLSLISSQVPSTTQPPFPPAPDL